MMEHKILKEKNEKFFGIFLISLFFIVGGFFADSGLASENSNPNEILMRSTFKIEGKESTGTAFIIGEPLKADLNRARYVLVTANHVLEGVKEDEVIFHLREKKNGNYQKLRDRIKIRDKGKPLCTKHPEADVASMYVSLPENLDIQLLTLDLLASDTQLEKYEISPSDSLLSLGFPYGAEANKAGFPILKSGKLSSHPVTPMKEVGNFLFDFEVFGGNSGGPVYFVDSGRTYDGAMHVGTIQFIVGLVSSKKMVKEKIPSLTEITVKKHKLGLAQVIPSSYIRETIDLLP